MDLSYTTYDIHCTHPFGISRSVHDYYTVVFIYIEHEGILGRGEAAPSARYGENSERILTCLQQGIQLPPTMNSPQEMEAQIFPHLQGIKSLEAAFSMALLDWWTQKQGQPLYQYFDADPVKTPVTSFTIALGDPALLEQKIEEAAPYKILKVKLGTDHDQEIINSIRALTDKPIRVDANEGWDFPTAEEMCRWLADQNVEFVEQPFPAAKLNQTAALKTVSPLPIFADENSLTATDIPHIAHAFHGINIKLMKCGSLFEARKMIRLARENDLQIMLGCMLESSVGITAAAHLSPLVDHADLDGNLLITNDPYEGAKISEGWLRLPESPGLGVTLKEQDSAEKGLK
jgi:L-alanine-DL-glutamate epimerase-like enolase superfamily enzyme